MVKEADNSDEVVTITEETIEDSPKKRGSHSKKKITKKTVTKKSSKKKPSRKKSSRKKTTKKKTTRKRASSSITRENERTEKILIENFISMQKVMTNMAEKFDGLSNQISKLLHLFENSAKALTEKEINLEFKGVDKQKDLLEKLNLVLEQNKVIAKGLTLMHETAVTPGSYYSLNDRQRPTSGRPISPVSFETSSPAVQRMPNQMGQQAPQPMPRPAIKQEDSPKMELGLMSSSPETPPQNFGAPTNDKINSKERPFGSEFS